MRKLLLIFLLMPFLGIGQTTPISTNGHVHTPKGHLHMLVIFIRYTNADLMPGQPAWPNSSKPEDMPVFARGENNHLFVNDTLWFQRPDRNHNLSDYYYLNSGGKFKVTADVYPVQVPIKYSKSGSYYQRYIKMNQAAIDWIVENDPEFDWSRYDNRKNYPAYKIDNTDSEPDGILDYVIINHRAPGSNGFGNTGSLRVPGTDFRINSGHTAITCYADKKHNWVYNTHEFAHNLFNCPHQMGANTSDGNKYYVQKGWGMMAAWHAPFYTVNAWEAWWLGWLDLQEVQESGKYEIKDFLTERDAIRLRIPNSQDYLWIENHQKKHYWDDKIFYNDSLKDEPQVEKGLYMYVVSGEANFRESPKLSPFKKNNVNAIRLFNAEGNFDYECIDEKQNNWQVFKKTKPNPFAGQNDFQFIKADLDKNQHICVPFMHGNNDGRSCDQIDIWSEKIGGKNVLTYGNTGNQNDALGVGDEVGLSGVFPVTNYPNFNKIRDTLESYIVSGIRIKVLEEKENGTFVLDIDFDDWDLRKSQRWCGSLKMAQQTDTNRIEHLNILPNQTLSLELSGTPNRQKPHPQTGTCAAPTRLIIPKGRGIKVNRKATLLVDKNSYLVFEDESQLRIKRGGKLIVEGQILFANEEGFKPSKGAKVRIKGGKIKYGKK